MANGGGLFTIRRCFCQRQLATLAFAPSEKDQFEIHSNNEKFRGNQELTAIVDITESSEITANLYVGSVDHSAFKYSPLEMAAFRTTKCSQCIVEGWQKIFFGYSRFWQSNN